MANSCSHTKHFMPMNIRCLACVCAHTHVCMCTRTCAGVVSTPEGMAEKGNAASGKVRAPWASGKARSSSPCCPCFILRNTSKRSSGCFFVFSQESGLHLCSEALNFQVNNLRWATAGRVSIVHGHRIILQRLSFHLRRMSLLALMAAKATR